MALVSIIVPVYKVESYLERCIESIREQTLQDIEIILVDDGSPDNCPRICDEYAKIDSRIKVIHKPNGGVSSARNIGLDNATGEYVTFVDSDDYIDKNMYSSMIGIAEKYKCDLILCDCKKEYPEYVKIYSHNIRAGFYNKEQLKKEYYPHLLMMENLEYPATISNWLCLFRNRLCESNSQSSLAKESNPLRYVEGVRFSEDLLFGAQLIYRANSFYYMKGQAYYHYCMNMQSATHTFVKDKWDDYLILHKESKNFFLSCKEYDFQYQIDLMLLFFVFNAIGDIRYSNQSKAKKIYMIKKICYEECVVEMFERINPFKLNVSLKQKIITCIYKYKIGLNLIVKK